MAIGAIAPLLVGGGMIAGGMLSGSKSDPGSEFMNRAYNEFGMIDDPDLAELRYQVQQLELQGIITPEDAQTIMQDPSLMRQVVGSPEAKSAQMQALSGLQDIVAGQGMTAADKATLAEINSQQAAQERGSREALAMSARERGVGGSGVDLVNQMIAQQESAGRGSQAGLDVAKMAQERALRALTETGQLGGQIESQQFGEESAKAQAQDAINRFNAANKQNVELTNVASRNTAQAQNLAERQRIADTNVGLANEKARIDADARQKQFENALKIAAGKTGQLSNMATGARETAAGNQAFQGSMIGAGGQILSKADLSGLFGKKKKEEE